MSDPRRTPPGEIPLLSMRGVTLSFGPKIIQQNLSFDVRRGSIYRVVMGGSGCGKSTVLKSMIGLHATVRASAISLSRARITGRAANC